MPIANVVTSRVVVATTNPHTSFGVYYLIKETVRRKMDRKHHSDGPSLSAEQVEAGIKRAVDQLPKQPARTLTVCCVSCGGDPRSSYPAEAIVRPMPNPPPRTEALEHGAAVAALQRWFVGLRCRWLGPDKSRQRPLVARRQHGNNAAWLDGFPAPEQ